MTLEEAYTLLETGTTYGAYDARRVAAQQALDEDASPTAIRRLLDAVESAAARQKKPFPMPGLLVSDVVISGVLRHHPRPDIVPVVAARLEEVLNSDAWRERQEPTIGLIEALTFLLARRALDEHRLQIASLWAEIPYGKRLAEKWGDDDLKRRVLGSPT
jgi:hypothetical protein